MRWCPKQIWPSRNGPNNHRVTTTSSGDNFQTDSQGLRQEWCRLIAEFLDTFVLIFLAAGAAVIDAVAGDAAVLTPWGVPRRWSRRRCW